MRIISNISTFWQKATISKEGDLFLFCWKIMSISCSEIQTRNETINISFHSLLFLFFGLYLVEFF